ncbi:hypothetical protein FRZ44_39040 [Hypericibacter terrae]|jgi:hypothetical protein|uniref:Lipoprotein n=1 Tax=Hypericibacter terrae TaxID=2602015 RepID=A0A5J6MN51_9PROT|nr:hypothetical protein [Hypericibacter terrae]QEX18597.1 hypothetical protein FRZ44_39040 [Hypericibacter terrae]
MVNTGSRRPKVMSMLALAGTASAISMCQPNQPDVIAYVEPPTIYCYHSLGTPDCYAQPLPGEYNRMIGYYGAPPTEMPAQQAPGVTITRSDPGM